MAKQADLTDCIVSLQQTSDFLRAETKKLLALSDRAVKQIKPTFHLCDGIGTVLDEAGKYMYDCGLDELYKEMQNDARKLASKGAFARSAKPLRGHGG